MESDTDFGDEDEEEEEMNDAEMLWWGDLEEGELQNLLSDAATAKEAAISGLKPKAKRIKSTVQEGVPDSPPKKKRKTDKGPAFNLEEPEFVSSKSSSHPHEKATDVFGEATSLDYVDAADKRAQQKSLRFLTSKIESADARRKGARTNALGGDDDIPYRERKKEKEARVAKEAQAKLKKQGGADLDNVDPEPNKNKEDSSGDSNDESQGYYELIKRASKEKKEKKKADYDAARAAE